MRLLRALVLFAAMAGFLFAGSVVRVVVMMDQTGSTLQTGVPRLTLDDFEPLIALVKEIGGELAVGAIREASDRSLVRQNFDPPTPRQPIVPVPPDMNVFQRQKLLREYAAAAEKVARAESAWRDKNEKAAADLRERLAHLLTASLAGQTDIRGAIERVRLFLNEPRGMDAPPVLRFCLLHTDGIETLRKMGAMAPLPGARVFIVNSAGELGILSPLKPLRFESFPAAVKYIRAVSHEGESR